MKAINKKELRNNYLDLSNELSDVTTKEGFYKFLPKMLPFIKKYSSEFLVDVMINEVEQKEIQLF